MNRFQKTSAAIMLVAIAPILSSCSTVLPIAAALAAGGSGGAPVTCTSLSLEKKYYGAQAAYNGALQALNGALDAKLIVKGSPLAMKAKGILLNMMDARKAMVVAHNACNAETLALQVEGVIALAGDLQMLVATRK